MKRTWRALGLVVALALCASGRLAADNSSKLRDAVRANDIEKVKALLGSRDVDINGANKWGQTALHVAASRGYQEIVEMLIASGADVNVKDEDGKTPFEFAVKKGHTKTALLLAKAARKDENKTDSEKASPSGPATPSEAKPEAEPDAAAAKAEAPPAPAPRKPYRKQTLKVGMSTITSGEDFEISLEGSTLKYTRLSKNPHAKARVVIVIAAEEYTPPEVRMQYGGGGFVGVVTGTQLAGDALSDNGEITSVLPTVKGITGTSWITKDAQVCIFIADTVTGQAFGRSHEGPPSGNIKAHSNLIELHGPSAFAP